MMPPLPASLTYSTVDFTRVSPDALMPLRANFSKTIKPAFLQYLAEHETQALSAMGINPAGIDRMLNGKLPCNIPGEQLDCSIDHIVSLHLGGTNDFDNLMLIPTRFNALKDQLETEQLSASSGQTITTIVPRDGAKIPFIDGGFQRAKGIAA